MPPIIEALSPARMNLVQRLGFFASLALATLVFFLHFPIHGYEFEHFVTTYHGVKPCPEAPLDADGKIRMGPEWDKKWDKWREDMNRCQDSGEMQILPLSMWRSNAPVIEWFGSLLHSLAAIFLSIALGSIWLWIFRTDDEG